MTYNDLGPALPKLVERLVASYRADARTQHMDRQYLPSRVAIVEICDLLLELTYPGYIGRRGLTRHNIAFHVGDLLPRLWDQLCEQISQSLGIEDESDELNESTPRRDFRPRLESDPTPAAPGLPAEAPPRAMRGFYPVTAGKPCPVCEKPDWCELSNDGVEARCMRIPSRRPWPGAGGGWLHDLSANVTYYQTASLGAPIPGPEQQAVKLAEQFLERMPAVRSMLADDVQAHYDGDPAAVSTHEIILAYPGVIAITIHRYAHELYSLGVPLMPRIMAEHAHQLTGIDINPGARIGRSFCIDHGTGVVIGETAIIGDNVKIYQGVTLGALSFPKDERGRLIRGHKRHPTVGNNVTIYANAIVLGGDTVVGDNAVVGGSVFVTQSVQPGHQVAITPPVLKVRPPKAAQRDAGGNYVPNWEI